MVEVKFVEIQVGREIAEDGLYLYNMTWLFHAKHFSKAVEDSKNVDFDAIKKQFSKEYMTPSSKETLLIMCYASLGDYRKEVYDRARGNRK